MLKPMPFALMGLFPEPTTKDYDNQLFRVYQKTQSSSSLADLLPLHEHEICSFIE